MPDDYRIFQSHDDPFLIYRVPQSDLCLDCNTPEIIVDGETQEIVTVFHDRSCPMMAKRIASRVKQPQR